MGSNSSPLQDATVIVPAAIGSGGAAIVGTVTIQLSGVLLVVAQCTSPIRAIMDAGSSFPIAQGFSIPGSFSKITLQNPTANPVTVTIYACEAGVNYFGSGISTDQSSFAVGGRQNGALNGTKIITGNYNGYQRKQIVITNNDANGNPLQVEDANANLIAIVPAGIQYPFTLMSDATVILNSNGQNLSSVIVGETYYAG